MKICSRCQERPRAHPKAAYCVECRRKYNRELRTQSTRSELPERDSYVEGLVKHLSKGGHCVDYEHYWSMSAKDVSAALGWYESNSLRERES